VIRNDKNQRPSLGSPRRGVTRALLLAAAASVALGSGQAPARAAPDSKPYDEKLMRLAEILGAMHYLRELCSANEGSMWRDKMKDLLDAEGATALRRARLTRSFNQGYRSYRRTYVSCTPTAQTSISRFMAEGVQISEGLVKATP
jgi:uncharacterized protein (TIGR02301 family)